MLSREMMVCEDVNITPDQLAAIGLALSEEEQVEEIVALEAFLLDPENGELVGLEDGAALAGDGPPPGPVDDGLADFEMPLFCVPASIAPTPVAASSYGVWQSQVYGGGSNSGGGGLDQQQSVRCVTTGLEWRVTGTNRPPPPRPPTIRSSSTTFPPEPKCLFKRAFATTDAHADESCVHRAAPAAAGGVHHACAATSAMPGLMRCVMRQPHIAPAIKRCFIGGRRHQHTYTELLAPLHQWGLLGAF